jgi:hypothetical protein
MGSHTMGLAREVSAKSNKGNRDECGVHSHLVDLALLRLCNLCDLRARRQSERQSSGVRKRQSGTSGIASRFSLGF